MRARMSPIVLVVVGLYLATASGRDVDGHVRAARRGVVVGPVPDPALRVALLAIAGAVSIDPHELVLRTGARGRGPRLAGDPRGDGSCRSRAPATTVSPMLVTAAPMLAIGLTLTDPCHDHGRDDRRSHGPVGRLGRASWSSPSPSSPRSGATVALVALAGAVIDAIANGDPAGRLPWTAAGAILLIPAVTFTIAAIGTRRANGGTFYAQAAANRRNSLLLVITLVGIVAATAEIIAVSLTFEPDPGPVRPASPRPSSALGAAVGGEPLRRGRHPRDRRRATRPTRNATSVLLDVVRGAGASPRTSRCRPSSSSRTRARTRSRPAAIRSTRRSR